MSFATTLSSVFDLFLFMFLNSRDKFSFGFNESLDLDLKICKMLFYRNLFYFLFNGYLYF